MKLQYVPELDKSWEFNDGVKYNAEIEKTFQSEIIDWFLNIVDMFEHNHRKDAERLSHC